MNSRARTLAAFMSEIEPMFLSSFGCRNFEEEIFNCIETSLFNQIFPNFSAYNNPSLGNCSCRTGDCHWDEKSIVARLKEKGIFEKIEEYCKTQEISQ